MNEISAAPEMQTSIKSGGRKSPLMIARIEWENFLVEYGLISVWLEVLFLISLFLVVVSGFKNSLTLIYNNSTLPAKRIIVINNPFNQMGSTFIIKHT